ncbi:MAG TPA: hypothetical protein VI488_03030 [Candidatus Angelobacter sp.]
MRGLRHCVKLSSVRRWAVLVCLLLVAITVAAQTFHAHPDEFSAGGKHCSVCQVAHAPARAASTVHVAFGLARALFFIFFNQPHQKSVVASFSLFCRPPPLV